MVFRRVCESKELFPSPSCAGNTHSLTERFACCSLPSDLRLKIHTWKASWKGSKGLMIQRAAAMVLRLGWLVAWSLTCVSIPLASGFINGKCMLTLTSYGDGAGLGVVHLHVCARIHASVRRIR